MMHSIRLRVHITVYTSFEYCILGKMSKRQKQVQPSLLSIWNKRARTQDEVDDNSPSDENENSVEQLEKGASNSHMNSQPRDQHVHHEDTNSSSITQEDKEDTLEAQTTCSAHCCSSNEKGFQPMDKPTLARYDCH